MARFNPHNLGLGLMAGGLVLGTALAAATPTQMRPPPDAPWRTDGAGRSTTVVQADVSSAPWFAADTYEVLPAPHQLPVFARSTMPSGSAALARSYGDDGDWRQVDADIPDEPADDTAGLAPEDDEPAMDVSDEHDRDMDQANADDAITPSPA